MNRPRILHVSQPVEAGVATVVVQQAVLQQERGWDVTIASPDGWLAEQSETRGVRHLPWAASREPSPAVADEARRVGRLVEQFAPDLVHLHSSKAGLAGRLSLRGKVATVFQPHAWSFQASTSLVGKAALGWERRATRWTDLTICCSEAERRMGLEAKVPGMSLSVGNGVDLTQFPKPAADERAAARRRLGIDPHVAVAVCVGRLQPQKGQEIAIAAWDQVRAAVPGARLLLVGGGPDETKLRMLAGDGVTLMGPVATPRDYFLAADVCVLASLWEGLSLALLEGMACARSTVATDVPGCREVLIDAEPAGAIVGVGQVAEMAEAIVKRFLDRALTAAEGQAARNRVQRSYTTQTVAAKLAVAYDLVWRMRSRHRVVDLSSPDDRMIQPRSPFGYESLS